MKNSLRIATFAALGASFLLTACGGADDSTFEKNLPSYDLVHLEMDSTDATPPSSPSESALMADSVSAVTSSTDGGTVDNDPCHPHLFVRTHEVVRRLNWHIHRVLHHVAEVALVHAKVDSGQTRVWENVKDGVDRKFTMTHEASGDFSFQLELAVASATPEFHTAFSGTLSPVSGTSADGGSAVDEVKGAVSFDYDAVKAVDPTAKASGQMSITYDVVRSPTKTRDLVVTFTHFMPEEGDPHGPRNGSYVYFQKPGVGGSLKFEDSLVLLCPSNPDQQVAQVDAVAEWYRAADGTLQGRADAIGFGGQIPATQKWQGVTCHSASAVEAAGESYWMMKLENAADGSTVSGSAKESATSTPAQCDPAFVDGNSATPSLDGPANDFPFSATFNPDGSLKDTTPFLFPKIS